MSHSVLRVAMAVAFVVGGVRTLTVWAQDQPPRFRSSVEVTSLDVTVVDGDGRPVEDLTADEFTVNIDSVPRPVLSAEWVPLGGGQRPAGPIRCPPGIRRTRGPLAVG